MKRKLFVVLALLLCTVVVVAQAQTTIVNGDFEQGPGVGWWTQSSHGYTLIYHDSNLPITPHSGHYAAWLGGNNNEEGWLYQQVNMPAGDPQLTFWFWVHSVDYPGYDVSLIIVDDTGIAYLWLSVYSNTYGWVKQTIDLSAYAGQSVTLYFYVFTDEVLSSNLFLDDISIHSSVVPTPTPMLMPTATLPPPTNTPPPPTPTLTSQPTSTPGTGILPTSTVTPVVYLVYLPLVLNSY